MSMANELADRYWDLLMAADPLAASLLGDHRFADRLPDPSAEAEAELGSALRDLAAQARSVDTTALDTEERITVGMVAEEASGDADLLEARLAEFTIAPVMVGPIGSMFESLPQLTLPEPEHAEGLVRRYRAIDAYLTAAAERLRAGVRNGRTPPLRAVEQTITMLDDYLSSPLTADPLLRPAPPAAMSDEEAAGWRDRLGTALRDTVRPALADFRALLAADVAPVSRPVQRSGLAWLPDGEEVYRACIRRHTSVPAEPDELHARGRQEIAGLAQEYRAIGAGPLGTDDVAEIFVRLRQDPALRFTTPAEVRDTAERALRRAEAAVPAWFATQPVTPCVVAEMGPHEAPAGTIAYYLPPAPDGSRPGAYHVNTHDPETRTRFEAEALAFHEAVPGHHLQIARAQELAGLPALRRHCGINAYVEGWALYTERLADEMNLYSGAVERLGMLSFDSWRACRLVVDTGLHHLGWSRQQAVDYLTEHSPQAANNISNEVDRYTSWPAQALGYKVGQRVITDLRRRAETSLGPSFHVGRFHDAVLDHGAVPLPVLAGIVDDWIADVLTSRPHR